MNEAELMLLRNEIEKATEGALAMRDERNALRKKVASLEKEMGRRRREDDQRWEAMKLRAERAELAVTELEKREQGLVGLVANAPHQGFCAIVLEPTKRPTSCNCWKRLASYLHSDQECEVCKGLGMIGLIENNTDEPCPKCSSKNRTEKP